MKLSPEKEAEIENQLQKMADEDVHETNIDLGKQIFQQAQLFHLGALRCGEWRNEGQQTQILVVPSVVNFAFAIELYLKAMIVKSRGTAHGHNWNSLYKDVPEEYKNHIATQYHHATGNDRNSLESAIDVYSRTFSEWRYIYENSGKSGVFVYKIKNIAFACLVAAANVNRDWITIDEVRAIFQESEDMKSINILVMDNGKQYQAYNMPEKGT